MGRELVAAVLADKTATLAAAVDLTAPELDCPCYSSLADVCEEADVLIDFSHHSATEAVLAFARTRRIPAVIATTGQTEAERAQIVAAAKELPLFLSGNMSIGIALLVNLCRAAVQAFPHADIEIIETHHNQKQDVPSGTALMLAEGIRAVREQTTFCIGRHENGKRPIGEVGIHSIRMGNVVGIHEVILHAGSQTITLKHEAHSRALFAEGALAAARFLCGVTAGLYSVSDLFS
jgi:4-hydroxy-tetrahydrodipicolinate reductase